MLVNTFFFCSGINDEARSDCACCPVVVGAGFGLTYKIHGGMDLGLVFNVKMLWGQSTFSSGCFN